MEAEKKILAVLDEIIANGQGYRNVPVPDGRMLRLLVEAAGAKSVVEIGTSTGYSGLWFSLALKVTGGHLMTFEADRERAAIARENFQKAGVEKFITIVEGDAHTNLSRIKHPIDVLFLDADKEGYIDYLNELRPRVRPGGLILAHNVDMVPEYVMLVTADPALETSLYMEGNGLAISLKKRLLNV